MEKIQPDIVTGYKGEGIIVDIFCLLYHQISTRGSFLKVSCNMESEILSDFFHAHLYLNALL